MGVAIPVVGQEGAGATSRQTAARPLNSRFLRCLGLSDLRATIAARLIRSGASGQLAFAQLGDENAVSFQEPSENTPVCATEPRCGAEVPARSADDLGKKAAMKRLQCPRSLDAIVHLIC